MIAGRNGDAGIVDIQAVEPAGHAGGDGALPGFVEVDEADEAQFVIDEAALDDGGIDAGEAQGRLRKRHLDVTSTAAG